MKIKTKILLLIFMGAFLFGSNVGIFSISSVSSSPFYANADVCYDFEETGLPCPDDGIKGILENFLGWLLKVIGIIAVISFIISGLLYLTSAGNDKKIELAKKGATYAVIGTVVALSGYVVLQAIDNFLRGDFF